MLEMLLILIVSLAAPDADRVVLKKDRGEAQAPPWIYPSTRQTTAEIDIDP